LEKGKENPIGVNSMKWSGSDPVIQLLNRPGWPKSELALPNNSGSCKDPTLHDVQQMELFLSRQRRQVFFADRSQHYLETWFRKTRFLKSPTQRVLGVLLSFGLYLVFQIFNLNVQLDSLLADLAHQLSFYLDSPVL